MAFQMLGLRSPAFAADSTLGQLVKQLRLAGFDTLLDRQPPDGRRLARLAAGERIVLTRSTKAQKELVSHPHIFIRHDQPQMQLKQVIATLGLHREDVRPLVRCSRCNLILENITREDAAGSVPEYVWQHHNTFKTCRKCRRVYWSGSHVRRWLERVDGWFE